jgi:hypothetical protein
LLLSICIIPFFKKNLEAAITDEVADTTLVLEELDLSDDEFVLVSHADCPFAYNANLCETTRRSLSPKVDRTPVSKNKPEPPKMSEANKAKVSLTSYHLPQSTLTIHRGKSAGSLSTSHVDTSRSQAALATAGASALPVAMSIEAS